MGCDGGTIPTRDEMVRTKKKPEQKDKNAEIAAKWKHCSISQEALIKPIMSCELGRLYNKESAIEFLLDRTKFEMAANFAHLRGLRDLKELVLTANPDGGDSKPENGDGYIDVQTSDYICPVTGLEMSGRYRFSHIWTCGCVVSERALKEVKSDVCHKCGKAYDDVDVICINGSEADIESMWSRMETRRAKAKLNKKSKSASKHKAATSTSEESEASCSKQQKDKPTKAETQQKSKLTNATSRKDSKLTNGDQKQETGIQKDPNTSNAYKSLFTSSAAGRKQPQAHWVTYNPMYY